MTESNYASRFRNHITQIIAADDIDLETRKFLLNIVAYDDLDELPLGQIGCLNIILRRIQKDREDAKNCAA